MNIHFDSKDKIYNLHTDGIPYLSFEMLDRMGIPNLYSTRYRSYDADTGRGEPGLRVVVMKTEDRDEAAPVVIESRARLAGQLGSDIEHECITDQKHTDNVLVVSPEDLGPVWPADMPPYRQNVDGMVTDIPDALLTVFGGDCPPVYIADPVRGAIGLVHAGWRGTLARIPSVAIDLMVERFGCRTEDMYAAVGPGICMDCYEMGDEVYDVFAAEWGRIDTDKIMKRYPDGKYHLDLRSANRMSLFSAGIPSDHIAISNVCTMCNADTFYSYRAHRMENEQAAMLVNRFSKTGR